MILLIDNFDSFAHNLARYLTRLGATVEVVRNDAVNAEQVLAMRPQAVVLSPGPCAPPQAGCSLEVVRQCWNAIPVLGVCLGHQVIVEALGGRIVRAPVPIHGRTSLVWHEGHGVFAGLPSPFTVCRYHSLIAAKESLPDALEICGSTDDGLVMAVQHREFPVVGVQFHPESVLTEHGYELLANFLRLAGIAVPAQLPSLSDELLVRPRPEVVWPRAPVTF
jgi:anthranilate synthase component 2